MESSAVAALDGQDTGPALQHRAYQLEMLEESLKRNIIVAMDPGSGKTQIAVPRIAAELERCASEKIVWFLTPTVALAEQQHQVLSTQLPAYSSRTLTSKDNVDRWKDQRIWDTVLLNKKILVSTPQVLLDALTHGFVPITKLALLVIDEAHQCIKGESPNRIMQDFYHPRLRQGLLSDLPHVLGLSASPVTKIPVKRSEKVEENLNAICRTPRIHREEMMQYVHRPKLSKIGFAKLSQPFSKALQRLGSVVQNFDPMSDPYVKRLVKDSNVDAQSKLTEVLEGRTTTFCYEQLKTFHKRSVAIHHELGPWAADEFISTCITKFQKSAKAHQFDVLQDWIDDEVSFLAEILTRQIPVEVNAGMRDDFTAPLSKKVLTLIELLIQEYENGFTGIVFVKQRSTAALLAKVLSSHHLTRSKFTTEPFVGSSTFSNRKTNLFDLADLKRQSDALEEFRWGRTNLIVATPVLEVGIDVSACNLVVRYDKPDNMKSYVQSRGRARKKNSKFIIFLEEGDTSTEVEKWMELEEEMKQMYMNDQRRLAEIAEREEIVEEGSRTYLIESTGARLTLNEGVRHLYHFCNTLPRTSYAELPQPLFVQLGEPNSDFMRSKVILPTAVESSLRETSGISSWRTERMANRDAAFEAYVKLHKAGLVNDNLLPTIFPDSEYVMEDVEKRNSKATVSALLNAWKLISPSRDWYAYNVNIKEEAIEMSSSINGSTSPFRIERTAEELPKMLILLPHRLARIMSFPLYWNEKVAFRATISPCWSGKCEQLDLVAETTDTILKSVWSGRLDGITVANMLPFYLVPQNSFAIRREEAQSSPTLHANSDGFFPECRNPDFSFLNPWIRDSQGTVALRANIFLDCEEQQVGREGLIRLQTYDRAQRPYVLRTRKVQLLPLIEPDGTATGELLHHLEVHRLPKRADFLHAIGTKQALHQRENGTAETQDGMASGEPALDASTRGLAHTATELLPVKDCTMDRLPASYAKFALFLPSLLHRMEVAVVVQHLADSLLSPIEFRDLDLVEQATSAPSAREILGDYQRLEFLGDCVLKFHTSLQLAAEHPTWHEGYLASMKDHVVSNSRLCRATIELGLDQFIHTAPFTGRKWRPPIILIGADNIIYPPRELSTKTLADVVEALIGAAELDGGESKTMACLSTFLPEIQWRSASDNVHLLQSQAPSCQDVVTAISRVESMIDYSFSNPTLAVEALTHPACSIDPAHSSITSYQRLEFLGDAILDHIIVSYLYHHSRNLGHETMHLMRTTLTNADFLAFLCLDACIEEDVGDAVFDPRTKKVETNLGKRRTYLWQFMRHSANWQIVEAQAGCKRRYENLRASIPSALDFGAAYPWALLSALGAEKMFSDLVESIVAAILIDSGSFKACEGFLEKIGLMRYLRRILADESVELRHPKSVLGEMVGTKTVKYEVYTDDNGSTDGPGGKVEVAKRNGLCCRVRVADEMLVEVKGGIGKIEVQTRAADEAVKVLRESADHREEDLEMELD